MSKSHVIGLASLPGAGKEGFSEALVEHGVQHLHLGTLVRATAKESGFVPADDSREAYLPFWGQYAEEHGADWLAKVAIQQAADTDSVVLMDGVRIPADAERLAEADNCSMVWLEGDLNVLAHRVVGRNRTEDVGITEAGYIAKMQKDLEGNGNFSMGAVREASEYFLLPVPDIANLSERQDYYDRLATHVLNICNLDPSAR